MKRTIITRSDLYEKVWAKPMVKLAKEYGISDVGLAKICKKMNIPRPYPGYWAKVEFGKAVKKTPLPKASKETVIEYVLTVDEKQKVDYPEYIKNDILSVKQNSILVNKKLTNPHPLINDAETILSARNARENEIIWTKYSDIIDIRVTPSTVKRALRIMDAIIKEGLKRNWVIYGPGYDKTGFEIDGNEVRFILREKLKMEKKPSTSPWRQFESEHIATGILSLEISFWSHEEGLRKSFKDKKDIMLEDQLDDFFITLTKHAFVKQQNRIQYEKKQRIRDKKKEILQRKIDRIVVEEKKIEHFQQMAAKWNDCENMRKFIQAVQDKYADRKEARFQNMPIKDWAEWANKIVDFNDPLKERIHLFTNSKEVYIDKLNKI